MGMVNNVSVSSLHVVYNSQLSSQCRLLLCCKWKACHWWRKIFLSIVALHRDGPTADRLFFHLLHGRKTNHMASEHVLRIIKILGSHYTRIIPRKEVAPRSLQSATVYCAARLDALFRFSPPAQILSSSRFTPTS